MAKILNKDAFTYEKEYKSFGLELRRFHDNRGWVTDFDPLVFGLRRSTGDLCCNDV